MTVEREGYLTDVEYTAQFFSHLAPAWLCYIAAINGYTPPRIDNGFTWCDLGCGKGLTALLLAATHPTGDFHACDFNTHHIHYAEALRRAAGVDNVRFRARSFAQMLAADVPPFDFITLHGVYSWVPDAVRGELREFIRRRLKPGGLVMVSYNAMPGWAHLQPIRRMMQTFAATAPADTLEKARAAFGFVDHLARNGAGYFKASPAAARHLEDIARQDIRYVAHEYLTPHGDPFYFAEMADAMRDCGLAFAGSMTPADNYTELMVPPQFRALMRTEQTRLGAETYRDFILNTAFRQDLYAAQSAVIRTPDDIPLERFAGMSFCLTDLPERLPLENAAGPMQFDLAGQAQTVSAVHELLARRPSSVEEIHRASGCTPDETSFLIQQLVVAQHVSPCPAVRSAAGWSAVNTALVEIAVRNHLQQVPLACAHTGSAINCEPIHAATIEAAGQSNNADAVAAHVLRRLRTHGHPVNRHSESGERRPATDDEIRAYVAATWRTLRDPQQPGARRLRLLGVLQ